MAFNSLSYFLFLPVVYLIFCVTADRWRWLILLGASYGFYAALKAPYLLAVLLMVTGISYACGLRIAFQEDETFRKRWLWIGCFACLAILALLKYLPFLESKTNSVFGLNSTLSSTIISIGVSYYTFQAISYLADIYLELEEPERHFGHYALYLAFFPKLLQGPIERAGDLLPQFKRPYQFDYDAVRSGMLMIAWGLFKKVVVADRLALYSDEVFNNVHDYTGLACIIGTYAFALQLYFDFAGYTDIARGTGRIFGISLTENFNSPYFATSIADFWRRWHISFSRWILDYIFKPLQMGWRNWGQSGTVLALIVTFLVSGVWHGSRWGFVIWGLLHGIYLASATYYRPYKKKLHKWLKIDNCKWLKWWEVFVTFNLVSFAWLFFRANNLADTWIFISNLKKIVFFKTIKIGMLNTVMLAVSMLLILLVTYLKNKNIRFYDQHTLVRFTVYILLLLSLCIFSNNNHYSFIYNQF